MKIVVGHGWREQATPMVRVPAGMTIEFYTRDGEPGEMLYLFALVSQGGFEGSPVNSYSGGDTIPNYGYEPFSDEEIARVLQLSKPPHEILFFNSGQLQATTDLCGSPEICEVNESHGCSGLLGWAERWDENYLVILACRTNKDSPSAPTPGLIEDGELVDSLRQRTIEWVRSFIELDRVAQDMAWENLTYDYQVYIMGVDAEMHEWAQGYQARLVLAKSSGEFAKYYETLPHAVKQRLLTEYPEVAAAVFSGSESLEGKQERFVDEFLTQWSPAKQDSCWREDFSEEYRTYYLRSSRMRAWVHALRVREMISLGLAGADLIGYFYKLDEATKDVLLSYPNVKSVLTQAWEAASRE